MREIYFEHAQSISLYKYIYINVFFFESMDLKITEQSSIKVILIDFLEFVALYFNLNWFHMNFVSPHLNEIFFCL